MNVYIQQLLATRQVQQFLIMCVSTGFAFCLLIGRWCLYPLPKMESIHDIMLYRGAPAFIFLVWNLFLAWIPYWIALSINSIYNKTKSRILILGLLGLWLLFFPNAPYIITDFLHLKARQPIPLWYDMMLIFSFAWTGLTLGLLSLYEVQLFIEKYLSKMWAWLLSVSCIGLAGFGIFIGRFQRWNSWDVFTQPKRFSYEMVKTVSNPSAEGNTIGLVIVMSGFMLIGYLFMMSMRNFNIPRNNNI